MEPSQRGEALAAAQMAKLLFGELNAVDQMTIDNNDPNKRANRINMDAFIAPLVNKPNQSHNPSFAYVPEELVQSMVPDTAVGSRPPAPNLIPLPPGYNSAPQLPYVPQPTRQQTNLGTMDDATKGNIASIANNLVLLRKDFAKVLGPLLSFLKQHTEEVGLRPETIVNVLNEVDISSLTPLVGMMDMDADEENKKKE